MPSYIPLYSFVQDLTRRLPRQDLAQLFHQCYFNSLETTIELLDDDTTFVSSGDVPAMWLRDSSVQIHAYLPSAPRDPDLRRLMGGVIRRQAHYLTLDPYANAFNREANGNCTQQDRTERSPWVWERKFELDSLCYPLWLAHAYWRTTGDTSPFDETFHAALQIIVRTLQTEQYHPEKSPYRFERENCPPADTLPRHGRGTPVCYTGMIWSGFRPSDEACQYGYHVPANMFAVVVLGQAAELALGLYRNRTLAKTALALRDMIQHGIQQHAIVEHPQYGRIYAYETDGYGNHHLMDDATIPSLLSLPYLGYCSADDPLYRNTRAFILSPANPTYFRGKHAQGIGSPRTPQGYIWHLALIMQGLTSTSRQEQVQLIDTLLATTDSLLHESFHPDDPSLFTRPGFAWANSLFGEFICHWVGKM